MNAQLTFAPDVVAVGSKTDTRRNILTSLINSNSPLDIANKLLLYKQILCPVLTHAVAVSFDIVMFYLNRLEMFQNRLPWFIRNQDLLRDLGVLLFLDHLLRLTGDSCQIYPLPQDNEYTSLATTKREEEKRSF